MRKEKIMTNNWIDEENARASKLAKTGTTANNNAPLLVKTTKKPALVRHIKSIYIQDSYSLAFDKLVFKQKIAKGKKAPQLMEEAIELLLKKYGGSL